jgi:hypothetical protein
MQDHFSPLDHFALHEEIRIGGGRCPACAAQSRRPRCSCGGGCPSCRGGHRRFEAGRVRAPLRPATRQTPAQRGGIAGAWGGWTDPVTLQELLAAPASLRGTPRLAPFFRPGVNLYRLTVPQSGGGRYLSIGMTRGAGQTIAGRMRQHHSQPSNADPNVRRRMRGVSPSRILVQAGGIPPNMAPRTAHLYEIWLQRRERVSDWRLIRGTTTFEDETLADLMTR